MATNQNLLLDVGHKSVPGTMHSYQDRLLVEVERQNFAVADGVTRSDPEGSNGALAAGMAIELLKIRRVSGEDLQEKIANIHRNILFMKGLRADEEPLPVNHDYWRSDASEVNQILSTFTSMGGIGETTITAASIEGTVLYLVNVGDSPALILRNDRLMPLFVPDVGLEGNVTQTIGGDSGITAHSIKRELMHDDVVVIASDGVINILDKRTIKRALAKSKDAQGAVDLLVQQSEELPKPYDYDDDKSLILIKVSMRV